MVAGALALAGLPVIRHDSPALWEGLTAGAGLATICLSVVAGALTLALVWRGRFDLARISAAAAVAAVIAGWAVAQEPFILPGLTISQAAAGRSTLLAVVISVPIGAVVLVPSLALLFRLFLRGLLSPTGEPASPGPRGAYVTGLRPARVLGPLAGGSLLAGLVLMAVLNSGWAHVIGVLCLFAGAVSLFLLATAAGEETR